jgi:5-methylcytosine-specific restriction enzyme A
MPEAPKKFEHPTHTRLKIKKEKERNRSNSFYQTKEWKKLRKKVLMENPWCTECLKEGMYVEGTECDHIIPIKIRPDLSLEQSNLQLLCHVHHSKKTASENGWTKISKS